MLDRRETLIGLGAGAAALLGGGRSAPRRDLLELAERLRAASREQALDLAARAARDGATHETLLAATFLAGIDGLHPLPGGKYHPVIMVESSFELAGPAPPRQALLAALWNLDDLKFSQATDQRAPWRMPPRPRAPRLGAEAAREELLAAMDAWDTERSERAVLSLLPHVDATTLFEILRPLAARCFAHIGHKPIYLAQAQRTLARIGWEYAEPVARSLVRVLLIRREVEVFERTLERLDALPTGWDRGVDDPAQSPSLARTLRAASGDEARELVIFACAHGLGMRTVWDGLRLFAAELFERRVERRAEGGRPALLPVHAVTFTEAMGHAWRAATSDRTRRIIVLQTAALLPHMRDALDQIVGLTKLGPGIDELGDEAELEELGPALARAAAGGVRALLDHDRAQAAPYLAHLRRELVRTGREHHQHKLAGALHVEARHVHPRWRARVLAPAVDYLAHPADPVNDAYVRADEALRRVGL